MSGLGELVVAHAQQQERTQPVAIYRPYQKAIAGFLEQINYAGPGEEAPVALATPAAAPVAAAPPSNGAAATNTAAPNATATTAAPPTIGGLRERLSNLKALFVEDLITEQDYNTRRASILSEV